MKALPTYNSNNNRLAADVFHPKRQMVRRGKVFSQNQLIFLWSSRNINLKSQLGHKQYPHYGEVLALSLIQSISNEIVSLRFSNNLKKKMQTFFLFFLG